MARTRVRITLDKKAIARLSAPDGDIDTFTRRVAGQARDRARLNLTTDGNVDTGRLRNSVQYQRFPTARRRVNRSEEHTSELQSLMRISYAVFCLQKKTKNKL